MTKALTLAMALPLGSPESYEQAVARFPMLSAEEERDLAERYQRDQDLDAARAGIGKAAQQKSKSA